MSRYLPTILALIGLLSAVTSLSAQQPDEIRREIQESQLRLEQIREERAQLQREMAQVRSRVQNVSGELQNIERQISASRSVLAEIDFQSEATLVQVERTTSELLRSRDELRERQAIVNRRLRDIYKLGPLHTARVLLGADSFTDLLNRYRYMRVIAASDRALMTSVQALENELNRQNLELQEGLRELARLRDSQIGEVAELRQIEDTHQRTLQEFRSQERATMTRLEQLDADEARMASMVTELERRRLEEERSRELAGLPATTGATLGSADAGILEWPVEGDLAYRFGIEQRPNGTVLRWNGIGIRAAVGTPVRAVRPGTVALAGPFEGYGPSVILSHGDGYYTLYLYLEEIGVVQGRIVERGQVVGTVGGQSTPEGARLEFQIRAPASGGAPQALDPLQWLRPRAGAE